jgi:aldehyde:ferredoxin oxidoreductase
LGYKRNTKEIDLIQDHCLNGGNKIKMSQEKTYGWSGKTLRVDLTNEKVIKKQLDKEVAHKFIGGRGLNDKILFDEIKPGIDPLGPENVLCLANGPLVGTSLSRTSRIEVSTLSPYSGILGDGNAGGYFSSELKFAGYDQIIITGKANEPKYLWICDESVKLLNASHLWGKTVGETSEILEKDIGRDIKIACIGQAGENLVRFANIIFDRFDAAARGSGAVLGSKNLKAIVVRGKGKVDVARPKDFQELAKEDLNFLLKDKIIKIIREYGSHYGMTHWDPQFRNGQRVLTPEMIPEDLRMENMKRYEKSRKACFNCPVACKELYEVLSGPYAGTKGAALDYETMYCCGTNTGIINPEPILKINNLANEYGLCTVALGYAIGFIKELYEKKIISKRDTGGIPLDWDADTTIKLVHKISKREGIGNMLAEGMYNSAKIIGGEAMKYCFHIKALSRGPVHPDLDSMIALQGLAYATSTRGADHLRGGYTLARGRWKTLAKLQKEGTISESFSDVVVWLQRIFTLADILQTCKCSVNSFPISHPLIFKYPLFVGPAKLISAATGWDITKDELIEVTDRIYALERAFNVRQGITRKNDVIPQRPEIRSTYESKKQLEQHEKLLSEYYKAIGWHIKTGVPTREKLEKLGIKYVADHLEADQPYPPWEGPPLWSSSKYPRGT